VQVESHVRARAVVALAVLFRQQGPLDLKLGRLWRVDWREIGRIARLGFPNACETLAWQLAAVIMVTLIIRFGTAALAGYQLGLQAEGLSYLPASALSVAATAFTGQSLGAQQPEDGRRYVAELQRWGIAGTLVVSAFFFTFARPILTVLTNDPTVIAVGTLYLRYMVLAQLPQNTAGVLNGSLRGAGHTRQPLVAMAVGLFIVVPLVVVKQFEDTFANPFLFNLVEGLIRIAIFILYLVAISLIPDLRKVFEYHGAEHKLIHAYEACGRPDADFAQKFSTRHPRCGTGFLLLVMVIAVFLFALVGKPSVPWLVLSRLIGIPLIIGIAYEIGIKWAGRHSTGLVPRIILWPGIQLQRLTTREPSDDQLQVAAAALEEVMSMDAAEVSAPQEALALS
jgi:hypothetical protein